MLYWILISLTFSFAQAGAYVRPRTPERVNPVLLPLLSNLPPNAHPLAALGYPTIYPSLPASLPYLPRWINPTTTPTVTPSVSPSRTPTVTPADTLTHVPTPSPTFTPTPSPTGTPTATPIPTVTNTWLSIAAPDPAPIMPPAVAPYYRPLATPIADLPFAVYLHAQPQTPAFYQVFRRSAVEGLLPSTGHPAPPPPRGFDPRNPLSSWKICASPACSPAAPAGCDGVGGAKPFPWTPGTTTAVFTVRGAVLPTDPLVVCRFDGKGGVWRHAAAPQFEGPTPFGVAGAVAFTVGGRVRPLAVEDGSRVGRYRVGAPLPMVALVPPGAGRVRVGVFRSGPGGAAAVGRAIGVSDYVATPPLPAGGFGAVGASGVDGGVELGLPVRVEVPLPRGAVGDETTPIFVCVQTEAAAAAAAAAASALQRRRSGYASAVGGVGGAVGAAGRAPEVSPSTTALSVHTSADGRVGITQVPSMLPSEGACAQLYTAPTPPPPYLTATPPYRVGGGASTMPSWNSGSVLSPRVVPLRSPASPQMSSAVLSPSMGAALAPSVTYPAAALVLLPALTSAGRGPTTISLPVPVPYMIAPSTPRPPSTALAVSLVPACPYVGNVGYACDVCAENYYGPPACDSYCNSAANSTTSGRFGCSAHGLCVSILPEPWVQLIQPDAVTMKCVCEEGFEGTECEACKPGRFGPACNERCSVAMCNYRGVCNAAGGCVCDVGWAGAKCSVCNTSAKYYGHTFGVCRYCDDVETCGGRPCDRMTGLCDTVVTSPTLANHPFSPRHLPAARDPAVASPTLFPIPWRVPPFAVAVPLSGTQPPAPESQRVPRLPPDVPHPSQVAGSVTPTSPPEEAEDGSSMVVVVVLSGIALSIVIGGCVVILRMRLREHSNVLRRVIPPVGGLLSSESQRADRATIGEYIGSGEYAFHPAEVTSNARFKPLPVADDAFAQYMNVDTEGEPRVGGVACNLPYPKPVRTDPMAPPIPPGFASMVGYDAIDASGRVLATRGRTTTAEGAVVPLIPTTTPPHAAAGGMVPMGGVWSGGGGLVGAAGGMPGGVPLSPPPRVIVDDPPLAG